MRLVGKGELGYYKSVDILGGLLGLLTGLDFGGLFGFTLIAYFFGALASEGGDFYRLLGLISILGFCILLVSG